MPKTRVRPGAFTLDLGEECNQRLEELVEILKPPLGRISKTHVLRWLVDREWTAKKLRKKVVDRG